MHGFRMVRVEVLATVAGLLCFSPVQGSQQPNVIVMQPDDLPFFDAWSPPPNNPRTPKLQEPFPAAGIPHMEQLRTQGLQFMQAYTTSPACGTSRFGTITGRYPSRSEESRSLNPPCSNCGSHPVSSVTIPNTKLSGSDCSTDNIAVQFKNNGYMTGVTGKWHLSKIKWNNYSYSESQETIRGCGFDHAEAIYVENIDGDFETSSPDGNVFSHNMEWVTAEAVDFINEAAGQGRPFFLYFNPTVPHPSRSVEASLKDFPCTHTPGGVLTDDPVIPGMTAEYGGNCTAYRQSVLERVDPQSSSIDEDLGAIWVDDAVGALLTVLRNNSQLNNTIFVFQIDHAIETKAMLYENGIRIAQFVHYPDMFAPGTTFDGPVTNLDLARSLLDLAGIVPSYEMDGESWLPALTNATEGEMWGMRCLHFEMDMDRAARCGCNKFVAITPDYIGHITNPTLSGTQDDSENKGFPTDDEMYFYLCDSNGDYITDRENNPEGSNLLGNESSIESSIESRSMQSVVECHLRRTNPTSIPDYSTDCTYIRLEQKPAVTTPSPPVDMLPTLDRPYAIVDTNQLLLFNNLREKPAGTSTFAGQDGDFVRNAPQYLDNDDGTITDLVTGLMWTKSMGGRVTWQEGVQGAHSCTIGGYTDWRAPSTNELYSLMDFNGLDPDPEQTDTDGLVPFINSSVFEFGYGSGDWRVIDVQLVSSTVYVDLVMGGSEAFFGTNPADGRIKGYPTQTDKTDPTASYFARYVRGNVDYGTNDLQVEGDVVKDLATGLMWTRNDTGVVGLDWEAALEYCQQLDLAGFTDWQLPDAKELQSIVDYGRHLPALDPKFIATPIMNEANQTDFGYYWTSTTHLTSTNDNNPASAAVYIAFGRAMGKVDGSWIDVHGAGAQRSDPKKGDPSTGAVHQDYPDGRGPQGDAVRIFNKVRCTRTCTDCDYPAGPTHPASTVNVADGGTTHPASTTNPAPTTTPSPDSISSTVNPTPATTSPPEFTPFAKDMRLNIEECKETRGWPIIMDLIDDGTACTGGLGHLMDQKFKVWACFVNNPCLSALGEPSPDWVCYAYNEDESVQDSDRWVSLKALNNPFPCQDFEHSLTHGIH